MARVLLRMPAPGGAISEIRVLRFPPSGFSANGEYTCAINIGAAAGYQLCDRDGHRTQRRLCGHDRRCSAIAPDQFNNNALSRNDDGSRSQVDLGFTTDFFGLSFDRTCVNNNGSIPFDEAQSAFTPDDLTPTRKQIIAPFFADVDTRYAGQIVSYGNGT